LKDELQKIEDQIKHVIHKRNAIGDWIKEIKAKIDDVVHKIMTDLNDKFAKAKEELEKLKDLAKKEFDVIKPKVHQILDDILNFSFHFFVFRLTELFQFF